MKVSEITESGWYWIEHVYDWRMTHLTLHADGTVYQRNLLGGFVRVSADKRVVGPIKKPSEKVTLN